MNAIEEAAQELAVAVDPFTAAEAEQIAIADEVFKTTSKVEELPPASQPLPSPSRYAKPRVSVRVAIPIARPLGVLLASEGWAANAAPIFVWHQVFNAVGAEATRLMSAQLGLAENELFISSMEWRVGPSPVPDLDQIEATVYFGRCTPREAPPDVAPANARQPRTPVTFGRKKNKRGRR